MFDFNDAFKKGDDNWNGHQEYIYYNKDNNHVYARFYYDKEKNIFYNEKEKEAHEQIKYLYYTFPEFPDNTSIKFYSDNFYARDKSGRYKITRKGKKLEIQHAIYGLHYKDSILWNSNVFIGMHYRNILKLGNKPKEQISAEPYMSGTNMLAMRFTYLEPKGTIED